MNDTFRDDSGRDDAPATDFIEVVQHGKARIVIIDYSGARGDVLRRKLAGAGHFIHAEPEGSLLILLRVRGVEFSRESNALIVDNLRANRKFVRATAIVGLDYLAKMVSIGARLTGRRLEAFEDEREALDWLVTWHLDRPESDAADNGIPIRWTDHRGHRILLIDLGNCNEQELIRRVETAASIIRGEPLHSLLTLNLVSDLHYSRKTGGVISDYVRANAPFILASAVVGLGYMKAVIPVLNRMTGRNIRAFDDPVAAQDWLVTEHDRRSGT